MAFDLNDEQQAAIDGIEDWLIKRPSSFFLLSGSAGTGKTFTLQALVERMKGKLLFTAPTNKATKVLRDTLTSDTFKPRCATTYAALGLRLEASGEVKELVVSDDPVDLSDFRLMIVDEGSMVNAALYREILRAAQEYKLQVLFLGDAYQLPPVGEITSLIWDTKHHFNLTRVMRHDNQILTLCQSIRAALDMAIPKLSPRMLKTNADENGGVVAYVSAAWEAEILDAARAEEFHTPGKSKVVAWRNVTVDHYNHMIRKAVYGANNALESRWIVGERVIFTAPAKDYEDKPVASTDDEGTIEKITLSWHAHYGEFQVYNVRICLDAGYIVEAHVLHPDSLRAYEVKKRGLAEDARADSRKWRYFWTFVEAFHQLRHAYAITAHRSQGSTYNTAMVDWRDILLNQTRREGFQCLYVGCSRPKQWLRLN